MKKNVFIDLHYLKNLNKGFGQFCFNLALEIPKQQVFDFHFTYYLPYKYRNKFGKNITFKTSRDFHRYFPFKKHYDIWYNATHLSRIQPAEDNSAKRIYTIHDAIFAFLRPRGPQNNERYEKLQSCLNNSSALVYISEFTKNFVQERFDIPEHVKQFVIYNGNPLEGVEPIKSKKHAFPYLLYVGEFRNYKNQKSLIPMLAHLPSDLKLIFVGKCSSKQREELLELAKKHKVQNHIILKGTVSETEKIKLYSNARAYVHPSLAEGFGLPVLEAMGFGIPCIISNNTSLPEVGGTVATYWDDYEPESMAQKVTECLSGFDQNPVEKAQALKNQAQKFSWGNCAKAYLDVFRKVAESN